MEVRAHRLYEDDGKPVRFIFSPHQSEGFEPRYLVLHYTASLTIESTVTWFRDASARASAHVIVSREGGIVQMVRLDRCAWHAGESRWAGREGLNAYAIGIELINAGALERTPEGHWIDWAGHRLPESDVIVARHRHESIERGWQAYPRLQIDRALAVVTALQAQYGFEAILGHDDIAPGRKLDPGPAFPMARFTTCLLERGTRSVEIRTSDA